MVAHSGESDEHATCTNGEIVFEWEDRRVVPNRKLGLNVL